MALSPVRLSDIADELGSLLLLFEVYSKSSSADQSTLCDSIFVQARRIDALLPGDIALADCDPLCRRELEKLQTFLHHPINPNATNAGEVLKGLAELRSAFVRHADHNEQRTSRVPVLTQLQRLELYRKYGAAVFLRDISERSPEKVESRVDAGIREALIRFPETKHWNADDWSKLFGCSRDVVESTRAFAGNPVSTKPPTIYSKKLVGNIISDPSNPLSATQLANLILGPLPANAEDKDKDARRKRIREWMQNGKLPANSAMPKNHYIVSQSALDNLCNAHRASNG